MPSNADKPSLRRPVGILYEHPEWFTPLFAELERRAIPYERIRADRLSYDPAVTELDYSLVVNRMSPSSWLRESGAAIFSTLNFLSYLDDIGMPVINGTTSYLHEISKARQLRILEELDAAHPRARVINHADQAVAAAEGLAYPVLVKPNVGGSGAGIVSFDTPEDLEVGAGNGKLEFGPDHTALVQEYLPADGDAIVRVEYLNGENLYAIRM